MCYKVLAQSPFARVTNIPETGWYGGERSGKVRAMSRRKSPRPRPYSALDTLQRRPEGHGQSLLLPAVSHLS